MRILTITTGSSDRVRQVGPAATTGTTIYVNAGGLLYQREIKGTAEKDHHYLMVAGVMVGLLELDFPNTASPATSTENLRFFHLDHLGSIRVISNSAGAPVERLAYDPWGKRRSANGVEDPNNTIRSSVMDRGFTTHEHLDDVGLVHMNGRVYDPLLGRFISADSIVQDPKNLESLNRYSYGLNSPLAGTDPDGRIFKLILGLIIANPKTTAWAIAGGAALAERANVISPQDRNLVLGVAAGYYFGPGLKLAGSNRAIANGAIGGFAGGYAGSGGSVEAAFQGAMAGAIFGFVGDRGLSGLRQVAAHGGAGCVTEAIGGGNCGRGALAAGFAEYAGPVFGGMGDLGELAGRVVVGGTADQLAGGSFNNGAMTSAFGYLFNQTAHSGRDPNDRARISEDYAKRNLEEQGYRFMGRQMTATIEGLPERRYDLVMLSPDGIVTGIEVKSSIIGSFRLNQQQVAFDVSVYSRGAELRDITTSVRQVMYYGVGFAPSVGAAFQNRVLKSYLDRAGIPTTTKAGVSLD